MPLLPITLSVRRVASGTKKTFPAVPAKIKAAVIKRDANTCQYCGFISGKHQTARVKSDKLAGSSKTTDYVTCCLFCEQCFALEVAGISGSGVLVWLPEMTQAQVNNICRASYVARTMGGQLAEAAQTALDAIMVRRYEARKRLGTDDPLVLATVLSDALSDEEYAKRAKKLEGLRLMPLDKRVVRRHGKEANLFPEMLAYWKSNSGPFAKFPPGKWIETFKKFAPEKK